MGFFSFGKKGKTEYIVAGLGNPGSKYENHTINVSKYEIESLAFTKYSKAEINNANIGTRIVLSCNRSGQYNGEPVGGDSFDILKMNNTIGNLLDSF